MNNEQIAGDQEHHVRTAFLLGWAVSETLGHLRRGIIPPSSRKTVTNHTQRLVASDGTTKNSVDAFRLSVHRIAQFYQELDFDSKDNPSAWTELVNGLPQRVNDWLEGKVTFYTQRELRDLLQDWSLQVWARLNGVSSRAACALTSGMSLADTYWYLRLPRERKGLREAQIRDEDWRRLLSKYRLDVERSRLQSLSNALPRYSVPVVRRHLRDWSIGTEVGYGEKTKLTRLRRGKQKSKLVHRDETLLQEALARQVRFWEAMFFGLREAPTFLWESDRWWIRIARWSALFVTIFVTALVLAVLFATIAISLALVLLPVIHPYFDPKQTKVSDLVGTVSLAWSVLIATPVPIALRAAYQFTHGAQQWLDDQLTIFFIAKRTYVSWDKFIHKEIAE